MSIFKSVVAISKLKLDNFFDDLLQFQFQSSQSAVGFVSRRPAVRAIFCRPLAVECRGTASPRPGKDWQ